MFIKPCLHSNLLNNDQVLAKLAQIHFGRPPLWISVTIYCIHKEAFTQAKQILYFINNTLLGENWPVKSYGKETKNTRKRHIQKSQEVSPFSAGGKKTVRNRQDNMTDRHSRNTNNKKDPQKKHHLRMGCKKITGGLKHV